MTFPPKPTDFKVTENQVILNKPDFYFEIIILRNKSRVKVTAIFLVPIFVVKILFPKSWSQGTEGIDFSQKVDFLSSEFWQIR